MHKMHLCASVTGHFVGPSELIDDVIERVRGQFESIDTREERVALP